MARDAPRTYTRPMEEVSESIKLKRALLAQDTDEKNLETFPNDRNGCIPKGCLSKSATSGPSAGDKLIAPRQCEL